MRDETARRTSDGAGGQDKNVTQCPRLRAAQRKKDKLWTEKLPAAVAQKRALVVELWQLVVDQA